jgi:arylsulfatase A-like enzyme
VDLLPTLLELLRLPQPPVFQGRSLLGAIRGDEGDRTVLGEDYHANGSIKFLVKGPFKLIEFEVAKTVEGFLFNLDSDPLETRNLYEVDLEQTQRLKGLLQEETGRIARVRLPFVPKKASKKEEEVIREILRRMGYPD